VSKVSYMLVLAKVSYSPELIAHKKITGVKNFSFTILLTRP